jgi:hypothetical protein
VEVVSYKSEGGSNSILRVCDCSGPCVSTLTSLSSWPIGNLTVVLDAKNYNRKIESLVGNQLVGGWDC